MIKAFIKFFVVFIVITTHAQSIKTLSKLNLNFETVENGKPVGWKFFESSDYTVSLDSVNVKSGKYSVFIEFSDGTPGFKSLAFTLPDNYAGKKITLSGYIKTENVIDGYAGLWMRIDPAIAFDNMNKNGVKGTTDWTKYEITLDMKPEKTEKIVVGFLLIGKGKMWVDGLKVSVDGKDISKAKIYNLKLLDNERSREFENGSQITIESISENQIEKLTTLGLIWGFLKYYHPNVAKGDYNWDYELFKILPQVLHSENKKTFDNILISWIKNLGKISEGKEVVFDTLQVIIKPDLDWITNEGFSPALTSLLLKIKNAKRQQEHHHISLAPGVGIPIFKNENLYSSIKYPDVGFRILSLYRYWNIIQYFFPYKNLIEEDWKDVLKEFVPKFINASNEKEYTLTVIELIGRIHDGHANIWNENYELKNHFGVRNVPIEITFIEDRAVITGFYDEKFEKETVLKIGDIISVINDRTIEDIILESLKYYPASNYTTKLRDIAANLLRTNDTIIHIEYIRDGKTEKKILKTFLSEEINTYTKFQYPDTCFKLINKDIAYLNNGSLKKEFLPVIWGEIEHTKGLIIDIRNYPTHDPIFDLSIYLLPESTPFAKSSIGSTENPGLFTFNKILYVGSENKKYYKGVVVILVNEVTQSAAEFHSMAYRVHPNSIVIGSTTAGADGNASGFFLPCGIGTAISGVGIYYPDGRETQRIGIVPDIELKPTIQGIIEGRDELLEKAIEIINKK